MQSLIKTSSSPPSKEAASERRGNRTTQGAGGRTAAPIRQRRPGQCGGQSDGSSLRGWRRGNDAGACCWGWATCDAVSRRQL